MFSEVPQVKQERDGTRRRWFESGGMELIVWYGCDLAMDGFQLCYEGTDQREHALTWRPGRGFEHARVDSGESRPEKNQTPILVNNGPVPWVWLRERFVSESAGLETALRDRVLAAFDRAVPSPR